MRVTDLEKFSLEQIWRPYQTKMGFGEPRLERAPFGLDETARLLSQPSDWSAAVLSRLHAIGVTFPPYIKHPLVDVVGSVRSKDGRRPRRCRHCGAGFLGNCGAYGAEIPREQCPHSGQGGGDGE